MDLVNEVVDCLKQNPEATLAEIFDPGLIKQLAAMPLQEYEKFRLHLEAAIILGGFKPKFSLGQLDKVGQLPLIKIRGLPAGGVLLAGLLTAGS
jgi:hypothetical protein